MIPVSLSWDTRKRSIIFKWNVFLSLVWKDGKVLAKVLGFSIPFSFGGKKIRFNLRWIHRKNIISFLTKWRLKKVEGNLSFPDPMVNGLLYGLANAIEMGKVDRKINLTINFLGENWCRGEFIISSKILFHHLWRWILPFLWETMRRRPKRR